MTHTPEELLAAAIKKEKNDFLMYEIGLLSLKAALSTRAKKWPVYSSSCEESQREKAKRDFRQLLNDVAFKYSTGVVTESEHVDYIDSAANNFSAKHSSALHRGRLRFGVAQKLINIHLKYLWVAGFGSEPPHCPLDGIVRDLACLNYDWISNDSKLHYLEAIDQLRRKASPRSLSVWELQEFRRKAQAGS